MVYKNSKIYIFENSCRKYINTYLTNHYNIPRDLGQQINVSRGHSSWVSSNKKVPPLICLPTNCTSLLDYRQVYVAHVGKIRECKSGACSPSCEVCNLLSSIWITAKICYIIPMKILQKNRGNCFVNSEWKGDTFSLISNQYKGNYNGGN